MYLSTHHTASAVSGHSTIIIEMTPTANYIQRKITKFTYVVFDLCVARTTITLEEYTIRYVWEFRSYCMFDS
jgi:hypothetical protein